MTDSVKALVDDIRASLNAGKAHKTSGLGTFSPCTRKATLDRPACTTVMFRASPALRDVTTGGPPFPATGPHAKAARHIAEGLLQGKTVSMPDFGELAATPVKGKAPKLTFHAAPSLIAALSKPTS